MHRYGSDAALSYASYRPPLHPVVLKQALGDKRFERALDFGCGTGQSAIALVDRCHHVDAIDSSTEMLSAAIQDEGITYQLGSEHFIPVASQSVDLATMAGVVSYLDLRRFQAELKRICRPAALLVPYDFKVILDPLCKLFFEPSSMPASSYQHGKDLSEMPGIKTQLKEQATYCLALNSGQAAALLLANEARVERLRAVLDGADRLQDAVRDRIDASGFDGSLQADLFWSVHQFEN